jgi:hypothetical protein
VDNEPLPPKGLSTDDLWARVVAGESFGLLFAAILVTFLASAVDVGGHWNRFVLSICFGGLLLLSLYVSRIRGPALRLVAVLMLLSVAVNLADAISGTIVLQRSSYIFIVPAFLAPIVVLGRVLRHPIVNFETIMGAIDAYLLIGIAFAVLFGALNALDTHYFFVQKTAPTSVDFLYFSFVVITTLGFGDLTPRTPIGRILVPTEALLGQIFLVTIVAALVGNIGRERPAGRAPRAEE